MIEWFFHKEGSTRSSALLRIAIPVLAWTRFAAELMPSRSLTGGHVLVGLAFYASSITMLLGLWSRTSTAVLGATLLVLRYYYGFALHKEAWTHHHVHVLALATCLVAILPCGKSLSVDRWLALRRSTAEEERGNLLGLRLVVVLLSSIYVWGTVSKLTPAYFQGVRMEQIFRNLYVGSDPGPPSLHAAMLAISYATLALEPLLAVGLWIPRLRWAAVLLGTSFHLLLYYLLPVGTFSLTMIVLYLAAFDADDVHAAIDRLLGRTPL